ncbi:mitogen activated protein kinase-like protein [Melanogaster broomeanus]|nr:mitogen activated protein kinase-like protein [Melanogaster broomeanus]
MSSDHRLENFTVDSAYRVLEVIGEGAYGIVCSAIHQPSQRKVAIKRITPFDHSMFCLRTLREIKLLRHFHHENIISILDILQPPNFEMFKEVYLVQELMETDLHRVIRTQTLSDDHCQYFIYQLCDFGLARSARPPPNVANDSSTFMTEYVATRWYRAPEVMLTFKEYTRAIDMWSVGCVLAEMLSGKPMFPGRDYHDQLSLILDVLGTPSIDDFYAISSPRSREYIRALPFRKGKDFKAMFNGADELAIDFIEKCLTFNPKRRITVVEALQHPYFRDDEPVADPIDPSFFDFDNGEPLEKERLKELIYTEVTSPRTQPLNSFLSMGDAIL